MSFISHRGSPTARIWLVLDSPYSSDAPRPDGGGYLLSGGMGFVYEKMFREAGLDLNQCYCVSRRPNTDDTKAFVNVQGMLSQYQPPFVLVANEVGGAFLPELQVKGEDSRGQLQKYAGSLLQSKLLPYEHYMMPIYGPDRCVADWQERNVTTYVDLQKLREEWKFWALNGKLKPLPERVLKYGNLELDDVLQCIQQFQNSSILSVDIETVYPRQKSAFYPHPGLPITIGMAASHDYGISFNLFRDSPSENRILWRALDSLFQKVRILGQNFFNFDALFLEALGFKINLATVQDTLIRHHLLWPELSHKLSFMTRQYTREPFYKDDGHHWSIKHMDKLRRYNALDVTVTMEIWEAQEAEFAARPHLRG